MTDDGYEVEIRPATYYGFFGDREGLSVVVTARPYRWIGSKTIKGNDEAKARAIAAKLIAADQRLYSRVTV